MRVLLFTHGTRGDVQPFAALARALDAAGHTTVLAAPTGSEPLTEPYGVRLAPLRDPLNGLTRDPAIKRSAEAGFRGIEGKRQLVRLRRAFRQNMPTVLDDVAPMAADGADVVVHNAFLPGHELAEWLDVTALPVSLQPILAPTASFPNPMISFPVPGPLNRATYRWTRWWARGIVGDTSTWRANVLGLPPRRGHGNMLRRPDGGRPVLLQAFSRHVLPIPADYPPWVQTTGFWILPAAPGWTPPPELSDFLAAGEPPVYIGFGSLVGSDAEATTRLVAEAARMTGVRTVVVGGWGGILPTSDDRSYYLRDAPLDWLLPRTAAIVHHGGWGTTGAALAAGRPQVICPFTIGRRFDSWRMYECGVSPAPIPQARLTASRLAAAIDHALSDDRLKDRAQALGRAVRSEGGVEAAVEVIETIQRAAQRNG